MSVALSDRPKAAAPTTASGWFPVIRLTIPARSSVEASVAAIETVR